MSSLPRAVAWMSGALVSFLLMALSGRELAAEISIFQIMACRSLICLLIVLGLAAHFGWHHLATPRVCRHTVRNVVHFTATYAWFFAVASIPLTEVFAIEFTAPIWTALLASVFLGERLTGVRITAIALGFTGVLIILRPGVATIHPAAFAALAAALGYAATYVITKDMTKTEGALTIVFWMNLIQFPMGLVLALPAWATPSPALWPWLLTVGLSGLGSHYCLSRALAHGDASLVVPLDFLRLPAGAIIGWVLYTETVDPFVFMGAVVIIAGTLINLKWGSR